jgi:G3E family GTPase
MQRGGREGTAGRIKLVVLGGYLGAGKTTLAVALAKKLNAENGLSVSIITNDQGEVLVDTEFVRNAGFSVRDVTGGCFCTKLPVFIKHARELVESGRPDVIIAEPIGTSTNILSNVILQIKAAYPDQFDIAPFFVVVDGTRIGGPSGQGSTYHLEDNNLVPTNQVNEAEIILVSKTDRIADAGELARIEQALHSKNPDARIIAISSHSGRNLDEIAKVILSGRCSTKQCEAQEGRLFAAEKASLGWYNSHTDFVTDVRLDTYQVITSIMKDVEARFGGERLAHVKILVESETMSVKMSMVAGSVQTDMVRGGRYMNGNGRLILNARVRGSPEELKSNISEAVLSSLRGAGARVAQFSEAAFTPKPEFASPGAKP